MKASRPWQLESHLQTRLNLVSATISGAKDKEVMWRWGGGGGGVCLVVGNWGRRSECRKVPSWYGTLIPHTSRVTLKGGNEGATCHLCSQVHLILNLSYFLMSKHIMRNGDSRISRKVVISRSRLTNLIRLTISNTVSALLTTTYSTSFFFLWLWFPSRKINVFFFIYIFSWDTMCAKPYDFFQAGGFLTCMYYT
jgi:hypothetical protein